MKAMSIVKGMAVGVMTGVAAGVIGSKMMDKNGKKKRAPKYRARMNEKE